MFGKKIKELRQTSGLNQTELAKKLDSTQSKISKYEREETLLQRFRALSKKGRSAALELVSVLDSYENN